MRRGHGAICPAAHWAVPPEPDRPGRARVYLALHLVAKRPILPRRCGQLGVALAVCDDAKGGLHERALPRGVGERAVEPGPVRGGRVDGDVLQRSLVGPDLRTR